MSELSLSDQLDRMELEDIEEGAKAAIEAMKKSLTNSYEHMIRVGHFLNAMKAKLPHGAWGPWLKENFEDSQQWAHRLMVCAADRANLKSTLNLTTVTTIEQHYSMLMNTPERQAKRAERQARKAEAPAKPLAPATPAPPVSSGVIRHENPPSQPQRPAWLADPDELERPEEADLPPLPKTNTHHTSENRRTPDARETGRAGLVSPDDPRELEDGHWYRWDESANRLFAVTNEQILQAAALLRVAESVVVAPAVPADEPKPGKLPTLTQLQKAIDTQAGWGEALKQAASDWAAYKMSLSGKEKIRSMDSWKKALVRMGNVAKSQSVSVVCEAVEKAIANGWTGWEHLDRLKGSPAQLRTQAAGTEDFGISYEVVE